MSITICTVDPDLVARLKKFNLRKEKNTAAISMKIEKERMAIVFDEEFEDMENMEEMQNELPEHLPRYLAISYVLKHDDGRISYPYCLIFISPQGCKPELQMMYASSKLALVHEGNFTKVFEVRSLEDLTDEWLRSKLLAR